MKQKIRTFIAVETDPAVREAAAELVGEFRASGADVKWVDPANMHLTVKFLGDVDSRHVHEVCWAVEKAVAELPRFELELRGAGAFPNARRPRTVWLGAGQGGEEIGILAEALEEAMDRLGFRREARRFHPHLTLGRVRRGQAGLDELARLLAEYADFEVGRTTVSEVVTFSSQLDRSGPTYEPLGRARLGGK